MNERPALPLLVGEIFVDVTVTARGVENKMRLGGIVHAARGFWALGVPFAAAVFLPKYLERSAQRYLAELGCQKFIVFGEVSGAPNVMLIFDPTEVDDQEYETLLRDEKIVKLTEGISTKEFVEFADALVFPGTYELSAVCELLPTSLRLHIDAAYDVQSVEQLKGLHRPISTIFISTSSKLFEQTGASGIAELSANFATLNLDAIILKENRGGSRLHIYSNNQVLEIPAQLGSTVNSVGVGDVFDATYLAHLDRGPKEAAWRAASASSAYAQTTFPDVFKNDVRRDSMLTLQEREDLGGTFLPWEERATCQIYLAAPDFENADRSAIERAVSALKYHNFNVRRPVAENGELPPDSDLNLVNATYRKDVDLLKASQVVFAVPTGRDPGTLVEVGLAIAWGIPVVIYDAVGECANTMLIAGSDCYSRNLDECLNATFVCLSQSRVSAT